MKLVPYDRYEIRTALAPADALARLATAVEPRRLLRKPFAAHATFQGKIGVEGFRIERIIGYRNSFLPELSGIVRGDRSGSVVAVTARLNTLVVVFLLAALAVGIFACLVLAASALDGGVPDAAAAIPLLVILVVVAVVEGAFWIEAALAKDALYALFR